MNSMITFPNGGFLLNDLVAWSSDGRTLLLFYKGIGMVGLTLKDEESAQTVIETIEAELKPDSL